MWAHFGRDSTYSLSCESMMRSTSCSTGASRRCRSRAFAFLSLTSLGGGARGGRDWICHSHKCSPSHDNQCLEQVHQCHPGNDSASMIRLTLLRQLLERSVLHHSPFPAEQSAPSQPAPYSNCVCERWLLVSRPHSTEQPTSTRTQRLPVYCVVRTHSSLLFRVSPKAAKSVWPNFLNKPQEW